MFESHHTVLLERFADKFGVPNNGDENARTWTRKCAEQFNYSFPTEGWGTKRASESRPPSTDVICRREHGILTGYDVVISAGASNATLNSHPSPMNINDQIFIPVDRFNHLQEEPVHVTLLGSSLFWGWGGYKKYKEQLNSNLHVIAADLGADYVRWFFTVGTTQTPGEDPYSDIGAFYNDDRHLSICYGLMQTLKSFGLKSHITLVGAYGQADTQEKRDAIVDRAAILIRDFASDVILVEMWNEYLVNFAQRHWLRNMARRLRSQLPEGFSITLSSPNCIMGGHASQGEVMAELEAMYGGDSGANELTVHSTRPDYYWNPETIRSLGVLMPILDGEPRGPGASAGGDVNNPVTLGNDYLANIRGRSKGYTFHSMPGIWGGHCDPRWNHENLYKNIYEVPNWTEIAKTLKSIRETGSYVPSNPIPTPSNDKLVPGQRLNPGQRLYSPTGKYYMEYQMDGNLVIYETNIAAIWASNSAGQSLGYVEMQGDGNFVLYNAQDPIGATGTSGNPDTVAQLQEDGNFVLYKPNGEPIWASYSSEWHT